MCCMQSHCCSTLQATQLFSSPHAVPEDRMHHPKIWENHCRRELIAQLEAKGKIFVPKGDANNRYDVAFHRTTGRVLVPHDNDALLAAQERLQQNAWKYKGSAERQSLQKRCHFVKKQIKDEKQAVGHLVQQKQNRQNAEHAASPEAKSKE